MEPRTARQHENSVLTRHWLVRARRVLARQSPILWGLLALAAVLRLVTLTEEPFHIDEARQAASYRGGLGSAIEASWQQNQPPMDHVIGWFLSRALGHTVFVYRLPSAVFGVAAVGVLFILLRRHVGLVSAVAGGLFLTLSPMHVQYSQYARPYALPLAAFAGALLALLRYLEDGRRAWWIASAMLAVALPWTRAVEGPASLIALSLLVLLAAVTGVVSAKRALTAFGAVALGLPSAIITGGALLARAGGYVGDGPGFGFDQLGGTISNSVGLMYTTSGEVGLLVLLVGVISAFALWRRKVKVQFALLAAWSAASLAAISIWTIVYRSRVFLFERYGVIFLPLLALCAGLGAAWFWSMRGRTAARVVGVGLASITLVALITGLVVQATTVQLPDYGAAAQASVEWGGADVKMIVYQPAEINSYRPFYPASPPVDGSPWSNLHLVPDISLKPPAFDPEDKWGVIWLLPWRETSDTEREMPPPSLEGFNRQSLNRGAAYIYTPLEGVEPNPVDVLLDLYHQDPTSGRVWALLAAARLAEDQGNRRRAAELTELTCGLTAPNTEIQYGMVLHQPLPAVPFDEYLSDIGLPRRTCSENG